MHPCSFSNGGTINLILTLTLTLTLTLLVYCGQTVRWIKMPIRMEVGLGPGHIVLDGDPAPLPKKTAQQPPIFGPCLL